MSDQHFTAAQCAEIDARVRAIIRDEQNARAKASSDALWDELRQTYGITPQSVATIRVELQAAKAAGHAAVEQGS